MVMILGEWVLVYMRLPRYDKGRLSGMLISKAYLVGKRMETRFAADVV